MDPGPDEGRDPLDVSQEALAAGENVGIGQGERLVVVPDAQGLQGMQGSELVAVRRRVDAVDVPVARVRCLVQSPIVDQHRAPVVDHFSKELVEDGYPPTERAERPSGWNPVGEQHDARAHLVGPRDGRVDRPDQGVDVYSNVQQVVAAALEAEEVRPEVKRRWQLLGDDLLDGASADGEVGVPEVIAAGCQRLRDAVRPSAEAVRSGLIRITEALGPGVADRYISAVRRGQHGGSSVDGSLMCIRGMMALVPCEIADFLDLVSQLPGVSRSDRDKWLRFDVESRAFGYLWPATRTVGLKQTIVEQLSLVAERPDVFEVQFTSGGFGWVVVHLEGVERDELAELSFEAWRLSAPDALVEERADELPS